MLDDNPWLRIPVDEYEAHMGAVGQSAALRQLFARLYAHLRPRRLAILGCTGGADFDLVDFSITEWAVGVDINSQYLERARQRYAGTSDKLRLVCGDVLEVQLPGGPFDLIVAALLLEYVDPGELFSRMGAWLAPTGVCSVVTQDPHDSLPAVSKTEYGSLELLSPRMKLWSADEVASIALRLGLQRVQQEKFALPSGKSFTHSLFTVANHPIPSALDTFLGQDANAPALRRATEADLSGVVACLQDTFESYRPHYTPGAFQDTVLSLEAAQQRLAEMTILVAEDSNRRIVGTVACHGVPGGEGHLRGMAVVPGHQGQGLAARLLIAAETELQRIGCTHVTLDTTLPLERAIAFYTRQGFHATGTVRDFFGMPLYEYAKSLKGVE